MRDHADTIRRALERLDRESQLLDGRNYSSADLLANLAVLDALVAENQQRAKRIAFIETEYLVRRGQLVDARAEIQRLRDALEPLIRWWDTTNGDPEALFEDACAAVDGTP